MQFLGTQKGGIVGKEHRVLRFWIILGKRKEDKSDQDNNNVGDLSSIYESILVMLKSVRVHVSA